VLEYARPSYMPAQDEAPDEEGSSGAKAAAADSVTADRTPPEVGAREKSIAAIQSKAAAYAIGMGIGISPTLLLLLIVAVSKRRGQTRVETPRRGRRLLWVLICVACLILPLVATIGAVALHHAMGSTLP